MKKILMSLSLVASTTVFAQMASQPGIRVASDSKIRASRVEAVYTLLNKDIATDTNSINLQVKFVVEALGGSTDVSPRKKVHFVIYSENEMGEVEASYDLGNTFNVESARRVSGGVYEIKGKLCDYSQISTVTVNASKPIEELKNLKPAYDFDSQKLKSQISVTSSKSDCTY